MALIIAYSDNYRMLRKFQTVSVSANEWVIQSMSDSIGQTVMQQLSSFNDWVLSETEFFQELSLSDDKPGGDFIYYFS